MLIRIRVDLLCHVYRVHWHPCSTSLCGRVWKEYYTGCLLDNNEFPLDRMAHIAARRPVLAFPLLSLFDQDYGFGRGGRALASLCRALSRLSARNRTLCSKHHGQTGKLFGSVLGRRVRSNRCLQLYRWNCRIPGHGTLGWHTCPSTQGN